MRPLAHPRLLLVLFCLLCWLPGWFTIPATDRDEARFVQATRQMLETGDYVSIRNGAEARNRKPIGIYWLQVPGVAAAHALGWATQNPVWPYRLPSLLGALLAVLATHAVGRRLFDPGTALLAAAMLGGSVLLTVEAHIAKTDAALAGVTTLAMLVLARAHRGEPVARAMAAIFWLAVATGILLKGPILPLVVGTAILVLAAVERRARWLGALRPGWGIPLAAITVLPWFVAIGVATHGGFFRDAVGADLGAKLAGGAEAHGAPPGTHLLLLSATLFPSGWAAFAAIPPTWRRRRQPQVRFLLAWLASWAVFEAVPTKLPHYILPLLPPLCLLAASGIAHSPNRLRQAAGAATVCVGAGLTRARSRSAWSPALRGGRCSSWRCRPASRPWLPGRCADRPGSAWHSVWRPFPSSTWRSSGPCCRTPPRLGCRAASPLRPPARRSPPPGMPNQACGSPPGPPPCSSIPKPPPPGSMQGPAGSPQWNPACCRRSWPPPTPASSRRWRAPTIRTAGG